MRGGWIVLVLGIVLALAGCARAPEIAQLAFGPPTLPPAGSVPGPSSSEAVRIPQNLCDGLPDQIQIKTRTSTFNSRAYFALNEQGRICTKPKTETPGTHDAWTLFSFEESTPIVEIIADDEVLQALTSDTTFYYFFRP